MKAQKREARTILDVKGKAIRNPENRSHLLFSKVNWMNIFNRVKFTGQSSLKDLKLSYIKNHFNSA